MTLSFHLVPLLPPSPRYRLQRYPLIPTITPDLHHHHHHSLSHSFSPSSYPSVFPLSLTQPLSLLSFLSYSVSFSVIVWLSFCLYHAIPTFFVSFILYPSFYLALLSLSLFLLSLHLHLSYFLYLVPPSCLFIPMLLYFPIFSNNFFSVFISEQPVLRLHTTKRLGVRAYVRVCSIQTDTPAYSSLTHLSGQVAGWIHLSHCTACVHEVLRLHPVYVNTRRDPDLVYTYHGRTLQLKMYRNVHEQSEN